MDIQKLIDAGEEHRFYCTKIWNRKRQEVMKLDNYECQICKAKGRYSKGEIVHHVEHLKDRPDLALSVWNGKKRQLITVCKRCHEEQHPESQKQNVMTEPITKERWD